MLAKPSSSGFAAWLSQLSVLVAALVAMALRRDGSSYGIGWTLGPGPAYVAVIAVTITVVGASWAIAYLLHGLAYAPALHLRQAVVVLPIMLLMSCLFAFAEEFGWRGYLLPRLSPLGPAIALCLSGCLWFLWEAPLVWFGILDASLIHINAPVTLLLHFVSTISAAIAFGFLRLRFRSVWLPTFAHGLLNTLGAVSFLYLRELKPFTGDFAGPIGTGLSALVASLLLWNVIHSGTGMKT
jgi:membrane protease YdiL (CAAX protease family)